MNKREIPAGYREDAQGRLVPESVIKPIDLERDKLVMEIVAKASELSDQLAKFKAEVFGDFEALVEISAEQYNVLLGGRKGNVTLRSYDGRFKVERANQDHVVFDERIEAAKALIDECLREWSQNVPPGLIAAFNNAFRVNSSGELRTARVISLRRHNIDDERWKRAMDIICDALQVAGSKSYIRVYIRDEDSKKFRQLPLDIAGV